MPNYKITAEVRKTIRRKALDYAERTMDYACADFPLTTAQVQNIVLPEDQVRDMRRLRDEGIRTIITHEQIRLALLRNILPGIPRGLVVALYLPEEIFVARATLYGISTTKFDIDEGHYLVPDLRRIDASEREALGAWVNRVVRAKRLYELTVHMIDQLVEERYIPTTSHLLALWPTLAPYVAGAEAKGGNRRDPVTGQNEWHEATSWKDRVRNPTRSLKRYQPEPAVRIRWGKLIAAADTVLTQGELLAPFRHNPDKTIRATAEHHEALPTDLDPKLA